MRTRLFVGILAAAMAVLSGPRTMQAQTPAAGISLAGGWTRNADLSDAPTERTQQQGDNNQGSGAGNGGGAGRRRGGGGGFGGRGGGGGGRPVAPQVNPEDAARLRDAMRDITNPSDHFVITQTDSMVVLTATDGRTTRLSPDGKKIKDENTKVERKTKWDGGKLVSEINGLGPGKMTQTFAVDPEGKQLRITVVMDGGRSSQPRTLTQVYDADKK